MKTLFIKIKDSINEGTKEIIRRDILEQLETNVVVLDNSVSYEVIDLEGENK